MSTLDTTNLSQLVLKLGLVNDGQLQEVFDEIGKNAEPQKLLFALERKGALTPYQTSKLIKGDTDGYFLGGYRMLYKIASGSFGRVYRADDLRSGRVVA